MLAVRNKVGEQDLLLNFDLLKSYLVHVVTSKGVPVLSDHKARSNESRYRRSWVDCAGSIHARIIDLQFAPRRADEAGWQGGGEGARFTCTYIAMHPNYSIMMMHPISFEGVGPRRGMEAEIAPFCLATPRTPHTACEDSRLNMTDLDIDR